VILASAFSAIVVFAQELVPGKVGMIAGLFFGLAFGLAGIGSAVLGKLIDLTSVGFVFELCSFLPLLGLLTMFFAGFGKTERLKAAFRTEGFRVAKIQALYRNRVGHRSRLFPSGRKTESSSLGRNRCEIFAAEALSTSSARILMPSPACRHLTSDLRTCWRFRRQPIA